MTPIEAFRAGFCAKAAELGYMPSELLAVKQSSAASEIAEFIAKHAPAVIGLAALGGGTAGALGNYFYNKAKFELDPEDNILPDYGPVDEAKKLHLLAKYRNAKRLVNSNLS